MPDDLRAHRSKQAEQLLLQILRHLLRIHRAHEILDERIEIGVAEIRARCAPLPCCGPSIRTARRSRRRSARSASRRRSGHVGLLEEDIDAQIAVNLGERRVDDARDAGLAAERAIKRIAALRRCRRGLRRCAAASPAASPRNPPPAPCKPPSQAPIDVFIAALPRIRWHNASPIPLSRQAMQTYLVGGAVRDKLLGRPVADRDYVVVGATPEEMARLGFRPVGRDFPVFLHPETREEYALARTERKSGRGYHGFVFYDRSRR